MDIEKWKEINTFYCEKLRIHLSPEQCQANRERPDTSGWEDGSIIRKPPACKTCTDWIRFCEEVYKKRREYKMAEKKLIKCKECGKEAENFGRGLCRACYLRLRKEGRLSELNTSKDLKIVLDFTLLPELFDLIAKRAKEELRTVEMQALWELKQLVSVEDIKIGGTQ